ncbi:MAG: IS6 family transposase [Dehalococcoidales bacterium]|nr:IS6 family transposase [Dehalococcoidales bacterium]
MTDTLSKEEMKKAVAEVVAKINIGHIMHTANLERSHYTQPEQIACKWCGSKDIMKYGIREGTQEYICRACHRKFSNTDTPFKKRSTIEDIGTSISSYYDGLSFADIARHLTESGNQVHESTVYRWVMGYAKKAVNVFDKYTPKVSDTWVADETAIKFNDKIHWLWDIIDEDTRFLLATYFTYNRGTNEAYQLMTAASKRAGKVPKIIITDKLAGYLDGIELAFGADTKHIQGGPFDIQNNTNRIERFQGSIKEKTKVVRGFKTIPTARAILDGFLIHYNFFKPHLGLKGKTPAEVAGIKLPFKTWTDFVRMDK